jgi:hypothetical protein
MGYALVYTCTYFLVCVWKWVRDNISLETQEDAMISVTLSYYYHQVYAVR